LDDWLQRVEGMYLIVSIFFFQSRVMKGMTLFSPRLIWLWREKEWICFAADRILYWMYNVLASAFSSDFFSTYT